MSHILGYAKHKTRPIVTDVAWCESAGHNCEPCEHGQPIDVCLGYGPGLAQGTACWGVQIPQGKGEFGDRLQVRCKVLPVSGVRSIFSTLFCRWQQRCGLSL